MLYKVLSFLYKEHHFMGNPVMRNHVRRGPFRIDSYIFEKRSD